MGLFDNIRGLLNKNAQSTHVDFNKAIYNYLGENLISSVENDDSYINNGYRKNATIYSIINLINKAAQTIPFQVYEIQNSNELKKYKALTSGEFNTGAIHKSQIIRKHSMVELEDTEIHQLLNRPNPAQSYNTFIQEIIAFGKLTGNRYIYGIRPETGSRGGKFTELYVLPSQVMEIHSGGIMQPIKEYSFQYNGTHRLPADQVLHIRDFNPYYDGTGSHLYGMSPLQAGLRNLDANNEALTTGHKYLQNQTARGVLMSEEGDLTETQARQLKNKFRQQYQGSNNAGDVIITPKKLSWINFGMDASDLSLIEQYNSSIKDLCNIYNVPVQLLNNTESSTYNNQKEAKKALYQNAVIPELVKIREELNRWLTPTFGEKLYIDFDFSVVPELQEEMDKVVDQMSKAWWITPNEKRTAMSYGVDEETNEMDSYFIPANLMPVNPSDLSNELMMETEKSLVIGATDMYTTIGEAEERAEQMGGSGYHEHIFRGSTVFMPFSNHEMYEAAKAGKLDEYLSSKLTEQNINETEIEVIEKKESFSDYPQGATNNARRMLEWREKYGRDVVKGGTEIGWKRANQIANRENLSLDVVKRVHSFLSRHEENAKIADEYKNEPWKDRGYVAYNLWGGMAMKNWAKKIAEQADE